MSSLGIQNRFQIHMHSMEEFIDKEMLFDLWMRFWSNWALKK